MLKLLNVGCGSKLAKNGDWVHVDMIPDKKRNILEANLLKGLPFQDNKFRVVYHSQLIEHFQKKEALFFLCECRRVMLKGGIIRIVTPDLQNFAKRYLELVDKCLVDDNEEASLEYEWTLLQIFDQVARNKPGGAMAEFLKNLSPDYHNLIPNGFGLVGEKFLKSKKINFIQKINRKFYKFKENPIYFLNTFFQRFLDLVFGKYRKIGRFRLNGEVHYCMYDFYSLKKLLEKAGFKNVKKLSPFTSQIHNWQDFELDVNDGKICDPGSLFVEANA